MLYKHKLKYRKFDQLIDSVADDLETYSKNALIDPSKLIKVVTKINKELGLRITQTKQAVVPINDGIAMLPHDWQHINFLVVCYDAEYTATYPSGTHKELQLVECTECNACQKVYLDECGNPYVWVETDDAFKSTVIYRFEKQIPFFDGPSNARQLPYAYIKDPYIKLEGVTTGNLYINYEGQLEDADGNLLVLDHPMVNPYYEAALTRRILRNIYLNGEEAARTKWLDMKVDEQEAKREAYGVTNMPGFKEIEDIHTANREAMFVRFFSIYT